MVTRRPVALAPIPTPTPAGSPSHQTSGSAETQSETQGDEGALAWAGRMLRSLVIARQCGKITDEEYERRKEEAEGSQV